ncbi:MAG: hypothetical protein DMG67_17185 [Acidobacteria bacterium]|nr:MAG: hypothetical protein DMG67_17185 [Acidobacteriota bacterium]
MVLVCFGMDEFFDAFPRSIVLALESPCSYSESINADVISCHESGRLALLKSLLTIRTSGPLLRKIICGCFSNEFFGAVYTHGGLLLKLALLFAS